MGAVKDATNSSGPGGVGGKVQVAVGDAKSAAGDAKQVLPARMRSRSFLRPVPLFISHQSQPTLVRFEPIINHHQYVCLQTDIHPE